MLHLNAPLHTCRSSQNYGLFQRRGYAGTFSSKKNLSSIIWPKTPKNAHFNRDTPAARSDLALLLALYIIKAKVMLILISSPIGLILTNPHSCDKPRLIAQVKERPECPRCNSTPANVLDYRLDEDSPFGADCRCECGFSF